MANKKNTKTKTIVKKWATFTYHSPLIRKVTNLFKSTDIRIAFRTTNTIQQQLAQKNKRQKPKWDL